MTIARVSASLHRVPVCVPLITQPRDVSVVIVEVESSDGAIGYGVAGPSLGLAVQACISREIAPHLIGRDPLLTEAVWHDMHRRVNEREQTGVASCALSGVDIALWDLRGKLLGQPVWRLLGGYSASVPTYVTFGLPEYDRDQLVEAARLAIGLGFGGLKMVVGRSASLEEDIVRVTLVREAIGENTRLMIDANTGFAPADALRLAHALEPLQLAWFEEPIRGNDVEQLAELRRKTRIPVAAGQFEGHRFRLRDLIQGGSVDIAQTNVLFVGGYTEGVKVAHLADAQRLPIANAGGWPDHNAHLMAAVANNHGVEIHAWQWTLAETLFQAAPRPIGGVLTLGDAPGIGLDPRGDVLADTRLTD